MAKRGAGKFDSDLDAAIYSLSLDGGPDEEASYGDGNGSYGLMRDGADIAKAIVDRRRFAPEEVEGVDADDLEFLRTTGKAGAIFYERSDGIVEVSYYQSKADMDRDWAKVEEDTASGDEELEENRPRRRNPKLRDVSSRYGAPMGRASDKVSGNVTLEQVRLDQGGYDSGGAYWGTGSPLWVAEDEDGNQEFLRASDRAAAVAKLGDVTVVRSSGRAHEGEDSKLDTDGVLDELLRHAAESAELPSEYYRRLEVTDELREVAKEYEAALWIALSELVSAYPPKGDADANDLVDEGDAPYNVYLTLVGSGVGIDDGRWEQFYDDRTIEKVRDFLEGKLGRWADDSGAGKLNTAIDNAVYDNEQRLGIKRDDEGNIVEDEELEENRKRARHPNGPGQARFDVYLGKEITDGVYFDDGMSDDEVRLSLIEHEGYDPRITVKKREPRRTGVPPAHYVAHRGLHPNRPWSRAHMNDLPDSAFLYIEPGGKKDRDGRTTPRSLRHFPYKSASGAIDQAHLRNALSRIPQSSLPADVKRRVKERAEALYAGRR